jgi:peptide-methionine (S)-S-oxide reductase
MKIRLAVFSIGLAVGVAWLLWPPAPVAGSSDTPPANVAHATFAGGCFWCMEAPFDAIPGVVSTTSGYSGGKVKDPTYEQVSSGGTGHLESMQVAYDPSRVTYEQLLDVFWHNVDPLDGGGQFCDRGSQYRTAIFYENEEQKQAALRSRARLEESGRLPGPVMTGVVPLKAFYPAEEYHQDYYLKNVRKYWTYRAGCGRDERLKKLWGDSGH